MLGYRFVDEAIRDVRVSGFLRSYMDEVTPCLQDLKVDVERYKERIVERFGNAFVKDELQRIAQDGSSKFYSTTRSAVLELIENRKNIVKLSVALAAWMLYFATDQVDGFKIEPCDPKSAASVLRDFARVAVQRPFDLKPVGSFLNAVYGLPGEAARILTRWVTMSLAALHTRGVAETLDAGGPLEVLLDACFKRDGEWQSFVSFTHGDEADVGVAPFDRVAAHIGLSDDDLLDFESDGADAPTLARVVSGSKLHRGKLKGRVSSEVYRLEQNARRSREENQELQSRRGSQVSRHLEKPPSRVSSSRRHNDEATSSDLTPIEKPTRRKSHGRSAEGLSEMGQKARRSSSRQMQMQQKTEEPSQPPRRSQGSISAKEKQRLQALVKEFAREAVAGFDLTLLDVDRGREVTATFSMDRHLLAITIDSHDEGQIKSVQFGVSSLTGVFRAEEYYSASHADPPTSVDPAVCLVLTTKEPQCPKVVIVLDGRRERDKAYTCLKILRLSVDLAARR
ncbi:hypothetical protein Emed_003068 [Eimeria media]